MADRVGVVGAGAMGLPIAGHLLSAGFDVVCCDLDDGRREAAVELGASACRDATSLGSCRAILVLLPSDDDVLTFAQQYAPVALPGSAICICSSVRPATCRRVADLVAGVPVAVVDAAMTGGVRGAHAGKLVLLAGGDAEDVAALSEVFAPWASAVHHLGTLGSGQVGKTVNNLIHWAEIVAITEALSLADALGVPAGLLREVLLGGSTDSRTLRELPQMLFSSFDKDIRNAMAMAEEVGRPLQLAPRVLSLMRQLDTQQVRDLLSRGGDADAAASHR